MTDPKEKRQRRGERVLLVSDVHLSPHEPEVYLRFMRFLDEEVAGARALYILGDLFDFFVSRRQAELPAYAEVFARLRHLSEDGTAVSFLPGNRDFNLDGELAARNGIRMLGDVAETQLGALRVLLTHGDLLCTRDVRYHRMRKIIRSRLIRGILSRLPLSLSLKLAGGARRASGAEIARKSAYVLDPDFEEVRAWVERGYDALVFGHVHTGEHYRIGLEGRSADVFVLDSWDRGGNFVLWNGEGLSLENALDGSA
jgi:UDP-2,3-diacylglucosamine hydrolase